MTRTIVTVLSLTGLLLGSFLFVPVLQAGEQPSAAESALDAASLGKMLENMGYEMDAPADPAKKVQDSYWLSVKHNNWSFRPCIALSTDKSVLWLTTQLCTFDPRKVSAERLLALLKKNGEIGLEKFLCAPGADGMQNLWLYLPMDNRGITPAEFRRQLEALMDDAQATNGLWDPAVLEGKAAANVAASK